MDFMAELIGYCIEIDDESELGDYGVYEDFMD